MNYLAHLALSGSKPEIIIGNYIGDYIKGRLDSDVPKVASEFVNGVKLHRFIDEFTDRDEAVLGIKRNMALTLGRAAGISVDIVFDHFLARHFEEFYPKRLSVFADQMYDIIKLHRSYIPVSMQPFSDALIQNQWLTEYRNISGIKRTFDSMARRHSSVSSLVLATDEMMQNYLSYEQGFLEFYPRIVNSVQDYISLWE